MDSLTTLPDFERFAEVRPGLFRCTLIWPIGGLEIPVATFLVRSNTNPHDWVLIDAGAPVHIDKLMVALAQFLDHTNDTIKYIAVTHAHLDHTAAIPLLLGKYPECKVLFHAEEKPFMCHGHSFKTCSGDTWTFTLLKRFGHDSTVVVPEDRSLTLRHGDPWEFDHILRLVETPGHTPGSSSYLHVPTRSLMVGDALMHCITSPMGQALPCISGPLAMSTCHWGDAMKAIDIILETKDDVDNVFPAHDFSKNGIPIQNIHDFHHPSSSKGGVLSWFGL
ncbi:hypothetical protein DFQ27_003514 [Actinomortierella ambigua]|uniref:Metallo-beta-lactamase domain-containing protein n=1 Tax=Actinomortierella ambigua TaxID=1343610 RepID=A0A9P6U4P7_9FUNG|nr:hypothetical protein DFQ26_004767 [Actinomortierella ambigua]KAG0260457.1 hypothetical protein DFQ27_003514 [Actinomortierella ambigua]